MAGKVVHFEVPYDDVDRATSFYKDIFGWQIQSVPELSYHLVSLARRQSGTDRAGYIGGGMFARQASVATPVITIDVDDIDASLAAIEARGGSTVEKKMPVGETGFAAYFTDSEGNLLGLGSPPADAGPPTERTGRADRRSP